MEGKILLVGWGHPPDIDGGLDVHVVQLFEKLREKGVEVKLALPEEKAPLRPGIIEIEVEQGSMKHKARKMSSEISSIAEKFDIIHTHDWFGAEAGFKAKKYADCNWISTMHSTCYTRTDSPSEELKRLERVGIEKPDRLIAVSNLLKQRIKEKYGRNAEVIHNGFSEPESSEVDVKDILEIQGPMIFYLGRLAEQKSVQLLIYAFKKLDKDATLVIGGEGEMRGQLEDFTEDIGLSDDVIFTGHIDSSFLGDYYSAADVFVSPSRDEPFGLTITEAISSGTPVVATECGAAEIAGDAIFTVEHNSESIREGIEKAMESEIRQVEKRTWEEVAEDTMELYDSVLRTSTSSISPG